VRQVGKKKDYHSECAVLVYLFIYFPDNDLVQVETCRWGSARYYCAVCWIEYHIISLLHGMWITLNFRTWFDVYLLTR